LADPTTPGDPTANFGLTTADGAGKPTDATIYYGEAAAVPIGPFVLGKGPGMKVPFLNGDIAEVLIYDRPFLSAGERQLVTDYLHAKWNATVPLAPGEWTRVGELGPTPQAVHDDLPLSDQDNQGKWVLDQKFSNDFKETSLDLNRWIPAPEVPADPGWRGRQPALFLRSNTTLTNGMLEITDRKGDVPEMAQYPGQGYAGYTTGFIETEERSGYGYYEIKARPMNSAFCSAFWMTDTGLADNGTEIDMFEIGAKAPGHEYDDNMTAHVWGTPQDKRHWAVGSIWKAPWKLGDDFHVYGFEWNKDELRWYVDGVLVHKLKNTNWLFPMRIVFDSEPMWQWFGKVNDADLPSTFAVQYLRVWRQQTP
jgi:beta-glucanase (GH16 family)